jgi:hypothetical protein
VNIYSILNQAQSFPVIVALETSASTGLSSRANSLHAILHSKHTSLLNTRYIVSAKASFDYQKKLCAGPVQGYRMQPIPTALLQRWYSLVREKRASRQDFLKALVKVFDVNSALKSSQVWLHLPLLNHSLNAHREGRSGFHKIHGRKLLRFRLQDTRGSLHCDQVPYFCAVYNGHATS